MARRPKVMHITTVDQSLRYLLLNQLSYIKAAGYEVSGMSAGGADVAVIEDAGFKHVSVPLTRRMTPFRDLWALLTMTRLLKQGDYDIVHTHTPKAGLLGQLAAKAAGVPAVVNTLHGFYFSDETPRAKRRFYIALERLAAKCSDLILSQNREDIETAVTEGIAPAQRLVELGNGIDVRRFHPSTLDPKQQTALRHALGLPVDGHVVGFVGRLVKEKGVLDLLCAARSLRDRGIDAWFLFVGASDVQKADALGPQAAAEVDMADRCVFAGLRQDMPQMYGLMDVLVLPSHREGFPRAPMEAAAMGVPTVATDIRGCRQSTVHDHTGLLYPLGDRQALVGSIESLLRDQRRREQLGAQALDYARRHFDERHVFERVVVHYGQLMAERGAS